MISTIPYQPTIMTDWRPIMKKGQTYSMKPTDYNFDVLKVRAKPVVKDNKDWVGGFLFPSHDFYENWHIMEQFPETGVSVNRTF